MKIAKLFLLASVLIAAAACAPKQQEAVEPSALDVIFSRKSVRSSTDEPVTDAPVDTLLRAAMAALGKQLIGEGTPHPSPAATPSPQGEG